MKLKYQDKRLFSKIFYSLCMVIIATVLSQIPVHGVNQETWSKMFSSVNIFGFSDVLSGGALSQLSFGGFAISSIIMSGILFQLFSLMFPKLEKIRQNGESGRRTFRKLEFLLSMIITLTLSLVLVFGLRGTGVYHVENNYEIFISVCEWFIGSFIICKMSQLNDDLGIGSGSTVLLAANIAGRIPMSISNLIKNNTSMFQYIILGIVFMIITLFAVYTNDCTLPIPIQNTRKHMSVLSKTGNIPMQLMVSSVMPVIYATSLMFSPTLCLLIWPNSWLLLKLAPFISQANWYVMSDWRGIVGLLIYMLLIFSLSFYSARITFSSEEVAMRMREKGDVIPNVRPGEDTVLFLDKYRTKLAFISSFVLMTIVILPDIILARFGLKSLDFMGVSLLILINCYSDIKLRISGMIKHWFKRYKLFGGC